MVVVWMVSGVYEKLNTEAVLMELRFVWSWQWKIVMMLMVSVFAGGLESFELVPHDSQPTLVFHIARERCSGPLPL